MKFTCGKSQLANALSNVQKAVATRSTIPALEGVLIKTIGDNNIELCDIVENFDEEEFKKNVEAFLKEKAEFFAEFFRIYLQILLHSRNLCVTM